ncbi:MAG: ATP-dependent DNA helicase RecG [Saprospiraceae bacterium]
MDNSKEILNTSIEFLKGVGPRRAEFLRKELNIFTFKDLLFYFPYRYLDRTVFHKSNEMTDDKTLYQIKAKVDEIDKIKGANNKYRLHVIVRDNYGLVELIWFQGVKWVENQLVVGKEYIFFGKVEKGGSHNKMIHPDIEELNSDKSDISNFGHLSPLYNSTERLSKAGLNGRNLSKITENLLEKVKHIHFDDNIPDYILEKYKLIDLDTALKSIHFPKTDQELHVARLRLKFDELFFMQFRLIFNKLVINRKVKGIVFDKVGEKFNYFYNNNLQFELTGAQKRVIKEIRRDLQSGIHMNRLLQGDVGSGKTIVALMIMLIAIDNGFQACLMAPTEILATQHYTSISNLVKGMNLNIGFMSGSVKGKARKNILSSTKFGAIDILIGTHALIEDTVEFYNLGIAIIDEQHRFGVKQRAAMWRKTELIPPHILVMTATPIPRTLSMTLYGDLDVSVIDELPPGRKEIQTLHLFDARRMKLISFIKSQIKDGRQVYVVYPLIEESEKLDLMNLQEGYEMMLQYFPRPEYQMSIVHGRMATQDKDYEMIRFKEGKTQILVSTTVIEVGVDVPNASVMVIENAERFGLSQLHQLRGRVGRGSAKSYCILMTKYKLSAEAKERIKTMVGTNNGFEIAEADLKLRGPGDIEGLRQSGLLDLKMSNIIADEKIMVKIRDLCINILSKDPKIELPENFKLRKYIIENKQMFKDWSRIS